MHAKLLKSYTHHENHLTAACISIAVSQVNTVPEDQPLYTQPDHPTAWPTACTMARSALLIFNCTDIYKPETRSPCINATLFCSMGFTEAKTEQSEYQDYLNS